MSNDIKSLEALLKVKPLPAKDENNKMVKWDAVNAIIDDSDYEVRGGTSLLRMKNFLIAVIENLPKKATTTASINKRKKTVNLAGKVWSHLVINDNTYSNAKKPIRDAIKNHFFNGDFKQGEDFMRDPTVAFDDYDRTVKTNAANAAKADLRQKKKGAITVSKERIEWVLKQMKKDVESGEKKYNVVPVIMANLAFGSRWVEGLMYSYFTTDDEPTETGRDDILTTWITQTNIAKKFNRGVDNREFSIHKPSLPYVSADFIVNSLNDFRESDAAIEGHVGKYDSRNPKDRLLENRYLRRANLLIQKRYFPGIKSRAEAKEEGSVQRGASSHMLRAMYVNLAYELFHDDGEPKPGFVREKMGHDDYGTGVRYQDIMIVDESKDKAWQDFKKKENIADVSEAELAAAENADDQPDVEAEQELADAPEVDAEPEDPPARRAPVARPDNLEEDAGDAGDNAPVTQRQFKQILKQNATLTKKVSELTAVIADLVKQLKK